MIKSWSIIFGIGLGILWLAGLGAPLATPWLTWLDAVAAFLSFVIAGGISDTSERRVRLGSPVGLSLGLFALWIIGLATGVVAWQAWWNFAFAVAYLILGFASGGVRHVTATGIGAEEAIRDRFRRSA